MNACLSVCGLTCLAIPARRVTRRTIRGGLVPVQPPPVRGQGQRPLGALADRQVNRPRGARGERDGHDLAALAGNDKGPVPAFQAQMLDANDADVRAIGLWLMPRSPAGEDVKFGEDAGCLGCTDLPEYL
jgi:hypothetical protein